MANREYINKNKKWLIDKSCEDGVFTIVKGVSYKVISSGDVNGKQPSARSIVTTHYTGRTIDGNTFDSSIGGVPLAIRLSDVIEGWLLPCRKCMWVTSGRCIFLPIWGMENSHNLEFLVVLL